MSVEIVHLPSGETIHDEETALAIRGFVIQALALSVPEFMDRNTAADMMGEWFPGDQLAVAGLYRAIAENQPRKVA